jgi:hypothetical protein
MDSERLNAIASGQEETRRESCDDARNKDGLFVVKRLGQARAWLVSFLAVAGAVLLVNGRIGALCCSSSSSA